MIDEFTFTPAQSPGPAGGCMICGNAHSTELHPLLEVLNRQTELLALIAGVLGQRTYRLVQQGIANASGFSTLAFTNFPGGVNKEWIVDRVMLKTTSTGTPVCGVYVLEGGQPGVAQDNPNATAVALSDLALHDFTNLPIVSGDEIKPILVKGGEILAFQWSGLSVGAICTARCQYRQVWQGTD